MTLSKNIDNYLAQDFTQLHSPAHCGYLNPRDLSEVDGLDDLQEPNGVLKEAQETTAQFFGAKESFFLVNGASIGMQASMIALKLYLNSINDTRPILVARNIHKSTFNGIILADLEMQWLEPDWDENLGLYTKVTVPENLENFSALVVTNPSYEGFYSQIPNLSIPVIVDEAHGAHYHFSDDLPKPALNYGADIAVQSWHKTLGSLTQTGVLHVNNNSKIPVEFTKAALKLLQTTSPSYILLESICKVLDKYQKQGQEIIKNTLARASSITKYRVTSNDPCRCLIQVPGFSGEELDEYLSQNKIAIEQIHQASVLAFINPGNKLEDIERLNQVLAKLEPRGDLKKITKPKIFQKNFRPHTSFFEKLEINITAPCPPGIVQSQKELDLVSN